MKTELFSISKFFTENIFRIPDYQRGYSWTEKQLKDFWGDIEQLENDKYHYTGVLTLEEVPIEQYGKWEDDSWIIQSKRYQPYYLVDGQQRITTIIILIQIIIEQLREEDCVNYMDRNEIKKKYIYETKGKSILKSYLFGYEKDNPSYEYLKTIIYSDSSDIHLPQEKTIYTNNLLFAKKYFSEKVKSHKLPELENIYEKITQRFLFNIYIISTDIDVCVAFETMNNRGKPLTHLELLKNRLIYLSTKYDVDISEKEKLRISINESWKSIYYYLGINSERVLDDDVFLLTHFFLYFGNIIPNFDDHEINKFWYYERDNRYQELLLDVIFNAKRLRGDATEEEYEFLHNKYPLTIDHIYNYVKDIKESVSIFANTCSPYLSNYDNDEKIGLERIYRLSGYRLSYFLVSLFRLKQNGFSFGETLKKVEKILFIHTIKGYVKDFNNISFNHLTFKYLQRETSPKQLEAELDEYITKLTQKVSTQSLISRLTHGNSYYDWKGIKYFLFEYEQELQSQSKTNRSKLKWEDFYKENFYYDYKSIEHIYPQKVQDKYWKERFNNFSVPERNILKNSLGNLLPISIAKNSSLKNKGFTQKKDNHKNKAGYIYGCYSEIEVAQNNEWTAKEIRERGVKLLDFMEKRWGINIGNREHKINLLKLNFIP
jgi:uncharacterized protein with ParB-like and HNH nuclease domain